MSQKARRERVLEEGESSASFLSAGAKKLHSEKFTHGSRRMHNFKMSVR